MRATGLYALGERQHLDLDTSQEHAAPNAISDLAYKGALRGHARSVWRGIIKVDKGAQGTDAFQENRNLLLSRPRARRLDPRPPDPRQRRALHARGDGQPGRLASCSSSSWRAGSSAREAEQMLVTAFYADALARIENLAVRERFAAALALRSA